MPALRLATITTETAGNFVFVGNSGSNDISAYAVNPESGLLTALTASSPTVRARVAPSGLVVVAGGTPVTYVPKFVYVANDSSNNVSAWQ